MTDDPSHSASRDQADTSETLAFLARYVRTFLESTLSRERFTERLIARDWQQIVEPKRYLAGAALVFLIATAWLSNDGAGEAIDFYSADGQRLALLIVLSAVGQHVVLHLAGTDRTKSFLQDRRFLIIVRAYVYSISNIIPILALTRVAGPALNENLASAVGVASFLWALFQVTLVIWVAKRAYNVSLRGSFFGWWLGGWAYFALIMAFPRLQPFPENIAAAHAPEEPQVDAQQ